MPKERLNSKLTKRERSWLHRAFRLAEFSPCKQQHGAVIVKGGRMLSTGFNTYRNRPGDDIPMFDRAIHAEEAAIRMLDNGRAQGAKIYVARKRRSNGEPGLSRPCDRCYQAIVEAGIKEIIFTENKAF